VITLRNLLGQPAVSLDSAERTGKVTGVIIDGDHVVAVGVDKILVPASAVPTFEGDALTYGEREQTTADPDRLVNPVGRRVLTVAGELLGVIEDLEISADGRIERLLLERDQALDGARLRAIGSYAAIMDVAPLPPPS
jgi:sporulation protein YlmC with PRC-barrel domain